jgi:hypothetical protein
VVRSFFEPDITSNDLWRTATSRYFSIAASLCRAARNGELKPPKIASQRRTGPRRAGGPLCLMTVTDSGCCSLRAFDEWVRRGIVPGPIAGTRRWDRKAIDAALDKRRI